MFRRIAQQRGHSTGEQCHVDGQLGVCLEVQLKVASSVVQRGSFLAEGAVNGVGETLDLLALLDLSGVDA